MQIVHFTQRDQAETAVFMRVIFKEMGWTPVPEDGLDDLNEFFHLPDNGYLLLVKEDGKLIGTGGVTKIDDHTGLIKRVYVGKAFRKLGIGNQILTKLVEIAPKFRILCLVLDVAKENKPAIHLYEKFGFTKYNQLPVEGWPESHLPETHYFYSLEIK